MDNSKLDNQITESKKEIENAYFKTFKPTIDCINQLTKGGDYKIKLSYIDIKEQTHTKQFTGTIVEDNQPGMRFKITLPNVLNVGNVKYKESYGLTGELKLKSPTSELFIPENSISDFETKLPAQPQILEGRFTHVKSLKEYSSKSYIRLVIPVKDKEMVFPTSILEYKENYMKFDYSDWDKQMTLIGISFMTTKGMFAELNIKGCKFHFYAIEQVSLQVIDSIHKIELELFRKVTYAIRLCFAFLSGKFYKDEEILVGSDNIDFSKIDFFDYQVEEPSIITENQIINPTFFFGQYSEKNKETQEQWKEFHEMFDVKLFSSICEKILDSPEFMRSIELIVNAGRISDPVQKGALYSVSIETITELIYNEKQDQLKPIPKEKNKIWKQFFGELKQSLENIKSKISEDGYSILDKKIATLNSPTNRDRLEKPFKIVGIELKEDELKTLNQRNDYLHGRIPDHKKWAVMSTWNALKLHCLIGQLILKYFKYSGHYIDISGWFLLHNADAKKLIEQINIEELKEIMNKIKNNDFESNEQLAKAKQTIQNLEKFSIAALSIKGLMKII